MATALHKVRPVDASGGHFDQNLIGTRLRHITFASDKNIRAASLAHFNNGHLRW
jgi:hypothetical protein